MHYIQKHILDKLRIIETARYTDFKPDAVESGHFRYHLSELVRDGHVKQLDRGIYALSDEGLSYVDKLSAGRVQPHSMPKVITYTLLQSGQKIVLHKKNKQPYKDLLNMVGGKLHIGETSAQSAKREIQEKTGLRVGTINLAGVFEVMIRKDEQVLSHVIAYVYTAEIASDSINLQELVSLDTHELENLDNLSPDFLPIYMKIRQSEQVQTGIINIDI